MHLRPWAVLLVPATLFAQPGQQPAQTPPPINAAADPLLRGFRWRSIGPASPGGRVDDIAVSPHNPSVFYLGFATGGIWKTTNNGASYTPIFDTHTHSIGDLAIAPSNPAVLYVGTGEPNNRNSSSFGQGVYKSTDTGRTFTHVGLRETQSIARVVVHPTKPDVVWVAAVGALFGPNAERGVFRSENGGRTWEKTLYVDENTGATDLVVHPTNPDILFAATYSRRRTAWGFAAGGPGAGIWKSADGGKRWTRVTGNGLPRGTMGRVALDISRSNPSVIYAQIEVGPDKEPVSAAPRGGGGSGGGPGGGGRGRGGAQPADSGISGVWRSSDGGQSWQFMANENSRPMYFSQIRVDPNNENVVYVAGLNASKSTDGGRTWRTLNGLGHVDQHAIWIDPANSNHVMYGNDGSLDVSWDGGESWESPRKLAVAQAYHVSADMRRPYHVCTGLQDNDVWCGPSSNRTGPILATDWFTLRAGGDGFYTQIDPSDFNIIYGEIQNANIGRYDLRTGLRANLRPTPVREMGGTGGAYYTILNVVPAPDSTTVFRWNWSTPFVLSSHDPATIYVGGNRLFKSRDRGTTFSMSPDLTKQIDRRTRSIMGLSGALPSCGRQRQGPCILSKDDGVQSFGTIVTIAESRISPDVVWVGTDDGNIQVSRDGTASFTEVGRNIPGGTREYYISRAEPSPFELGTAYVSLDGHRSGDLKPYVYVTRDFGATWTPIASNLPAFGNVNSVKQDLRNRNLLYAATEFGIFVTLDEGRSWKSFMTNLPIVRVDDILLHPRDNDLIAATHGRGIWIADDVTPLQQMTPAVLAQDSWLFAPRAAVRWKTDIRQNRNVADAGQFEGQSAPAGVSLAYYLKSAPAGDVTLTIRQRGSTAVFRTIAGTKEAGLNQVRWNVCSDPLPATQSEVLAGIGAGCAGGRGGGGGGGGGGENPNVARLAAPGSYVVTLQVGGKEQSQSISVLEDIWMGER